MTSATARTDARPAWREFRSQAAPTLARFETGLAEPRATQEKLLLRLLSRSQRSAYGMEYDFASIGDFDAYQKRVPITQWSDMASWVERAGQSCESVLTTAAPTFFERTSGSSAASKLIPYTTDLLHEFQQAVVVWLARLYDDCPAVALGPAYWALSPSRVVAGRSANGIPIGSASDAQYLQDCSAAHLLPTLLGPAGVFDPSADWRLDTLAALIGASDLRMLSVWSPTFLNALLAPLLNQPSSAKSLVKLMSRIPTGRRAAVRAAVAAHTPGMLWPDLALISCWMDGPSTTYADALSWLFPKTRLLPKGLFATEGVVSFSWGLSGLCPLAITSHVLEFVDERGGVRLADELENGQHYQPLLSTGGGLYRYRLGDIVEVTGFIERTPCVRFVGRIDARSDMVGEKLDERLVQHACRILPEGTGAAVVVPQPDASPPLYRLLIQGVNQREAEALGTRVERELMKVFHYAQARNLGQLAPLSTSVAGRLGELVLGAWEATGRRAGDSKPAPLVTSPSHARAIIAALESQKTG